MGISESQHWHNGRPDHLGGQILESNQQTRGRLVQWRPRVRGDGDVESFIGDTFGGGTSGVRTVGVPGLRPIGAVPVLVGGILPPVFRSRRRWVCGRQGDGVGWPLGGGSARRARDRRVRFWLLALLWGRR